MRASVPMLYTSHKVVRILPIQASGVAIKPVVKIPVSLGWKFYPRVCESAIFSKSCSTHLAVLDPKARRRSGKEWT
jgi:hypothetical protein